MKIQIFDLETTYLEETKEFGNVFTGWEAYLSSEKFKIRKTIQNEERLFSLSSISSPASRKEDSKKVPTFHSQKYVFSLSFVFINWQLIKPIALQVPSKKKSKLKTTEEASQLVSETNE